MSKKRKTELDVDPSAALEPEPGEAPVEAKEAEEEKPAEEEPKPKLDKKKKIIIGATVGVVLIIAIAAFLLTSSEEEPPTEEEVKEETVEKEPELVLPDPPAAVELKLLVNVTFEPFIIPFTENGEENFWKVGVTLQLSNPEALEEVEQNLVIFREALYMFLKEKNKNDFLNPKKRKDALFDMRVLIDRSLQNGQVDQVLITTFQVL